MTENTPGGWVAGLQEASRRAPNPLHRQRSAYYAKLIQNDMDAGAMPRTTKEAGMETPLGTLDEKPPIPHSMFSVDYNSREIIVESSGKRFPLAPTEFGIVQILQANCGNFVRSEGFQPVFSGSTSKIQDSLRVHIKRLRDKFNSNGISMEDYPVGLIESSRNSGTRGLGYRMLDPKRHKPLNLDSQESERADDKSDIVATHSRFILNPNTRVLTTTRLDNPLQIFFTQRELDIYLFLLQNIGSFVRAKDIPIFEGFTPNEIQDAAKVYIYRIRSKFEKSGIIEDAVPLAYIESGGKARPLLGYRIIDPAIEDNR